MTPEGRMDPRQEQIRTLVESLTKIVDWESVGAAETFSEAAYSHIEAAFAALLADTRAATEGSEATKHSHSLREIAFMLKTDGNWKWEHVQAAADFLASSAPTREPGWREKFVAEVLLRADNCGTRTDEYGRGLHAAYRAVLDMLPTPPRDERPQTGEREG